MESKHNCELLKLYKKLDIDIYSQCKASSTVFQYAAIDAYIDNLELPLLTEQSFRGASYDARFCLKQHQALQLSILSIIGTYTKTNNLIFFIQHNDSILAFLDSIAKIRASRYPSSIISICENKFEKSFRVTSHDTGIIRILLEGEMISLVTSLTDANRSMTFYLSPNSDMYATYMHNNKNSMWVSMPSGSIQLAGSIGSQIMPILYSDISSKHILRINIGHGQMKTQKTDVLESQLNAVNASIMSAVSKDNLCYCCAYMKKVHDILCPAKASTSHSFESTLLTSFLDN